MTMQTTTDTPRGPASERIERELREHFAPEVRDIERAAERATEQRAALQRPDGQPKWAPAEQAEREAAIDAEFEAVAARVTTAAEAAIADTRREQAMLDGADPFDRLAEPEQQRVTARRELLKEDVETLPLHTLTAPIRAALAADDRALLYLYGRYLPRRLEAAGPVAPPELLAVLRELAERLADPLAKDKRDRLGRQLSAAQVLSGRVGLVRRGGLEGLKREMARSGRYGL